MRWGSKMLAAVLAVLLLGTGLVACGGGDESDTGTTGAAQTQTGGEGSETGSSDEGTFTPKQHQDSGGGSDQYRVKGGDNSVQEFGEEAEGAEFEQAAATLHEFLDARAAGAWAAVCQTIASSVVDSLQELAAQAEQAEDAGCPVILEKLTNPTAKDLFRAEAEQADVGSLRVEDDRAFIIFSGPDGEVQAVAMAREDGTWKVATLAGTPLS